MNLKNKNILLGICAGIAAYKIPALIRLLKKQGANVRVLATQAATRFVTELTLSTLSQEPVYTDIFPDSFSTEEDWTKHISMGEWADMYVIAPATANTIAKLSAGICDDMLSASFITLRPNKPKLIFPAMDGEMFTSASVQRNLAWLSRNGCTVINPESGELASGQCGTGRMPEPEAIVKIIETTETTVEATPRLSKLQEKSIVITAGPTREKIDDVRFISNYSSGKMGFALATSAAKRGAKVTLVTGPVHLPTPEGVDRLDIESTEEMDLAVKEHYQSCDIFIGAAAVADYRPANHVTGKLKKNSKTMAINLVRNPDVLAGFSKQKKKHQIAIGFSLETAGNLDNAKEKLEQKQLDLVAYNTFDGKTSGFEVDTNILTLIDKHMNVYELPLLGKHEAAERMLDIVEELINSDK
ncbi:bifunctional phosphopantothenoylcysteine decarboxylase/phosphopantothenate--cysteine ligase CoaBC [Prosthecochloris sp. SCSIO W1102]|uniref:bifunctional phosphopantothenoylcysteine decarboxylase/phosphopantothenate--cysteine ligase CoaBC n=1 Tax=Prosthecochloris sp. SCSIO W1102 TaxID=2992243 RepID=UPI00223D3869|nr:bifunctional phosphopantothenoylcysteine decarboxylase/phosphopantothenate--cysteine ligase CoaBC [Prosthecochloris sp. SCSIO W1102]UZJ39130.1 bifunctional phosphopantothenoylcysteine decarboxylase/phosphopantothenate--cysteine ligase CoaBC [Prosthecochloris sp. SCSIO W1102]